MTLDEAQAALAANPAALVFAGCDFDTLLATFGSRQDPEVTAIVQTFRKALLSADEASRLMLTTNAITTLGTLAATRDNERAAAMASMEQHRNDVRRMEAEYAAAQLRRARATRMTHPVFASLRARLDAVERAIGEAVAPADFSSAESAMAEAFNAATASIALGNAALMAA